VAIVAALAMSTSACRAPRRPTVPLPDPVPAPADSARLAARPRPPIDRSTAARFEIVAVGDTTFAFLTPRAAWVTPGAYGIVVDPRRRDALVARFLVLGQHSDTATALITGQTNPLVTDHVALLSRPPEPPTVLRRIEQRRFWAGAVVGAIFGVIAGLLVH
jgi:hypothetical protein